MAISKLKRNSKRIRVAEALARHGKSAKQHFWKDASETLLAPRRNRPEVNLRTISTNTKDGSRVLIAGKVLGSGSLDHKVTVIAHSFSASAKAKIKGAGGACINIIDYLQDSNKDTKGVLVLG